MIGLGLAPEVWFPVVTLVGGAIIGVITQTITDWRAAERERLARLEHRLDAARDRRIEFQRATLLELQERAHDLARAAGEAHFSDYEAFKQTGKWRSTLLTEGVSNRFFVANTAVTKLRERVGDEEIRSLTVDLRDACSRSEQSKDQQSADRGLNMVAEIAEQLNAKIGERLRNLDSIEDVALHKLEGPPP